MTEAADTPNAWWSAEDVGDVAQMLAARRSRLWQLVEPDELATWVFADPAPAPLDPSPSPAPAAGDWAAGLDVAGRGAWALAGWVVRTAVPMAAVTAGDHWILSRLDDRRPTVLRLTVGMLELLGLHETGDRVWLRVHAAPILAAMESGAVDLAEWDRRGIDLPGDRTRTLAEEKLLIYAPDVDTAWWLLWQPAVMAGLRLLACWVAAGGYSFREKYRPEVAGRAWLAGEALVERGSDADSGEPAVGPSVRGFDRPYSGATVIADLPAQRSFDAAAYRAGVIEHDRLCRLLIAQVDRSGMRAGAGLAGIDVDLAWRDGGGRQFIAEVKSVNGGNEVEQLRLGLGQVLEYRHRLAAAGVPASAVLLVSTCTDARWRDVCGENGVLLLSGEDEGTWTERLRAEFALQGGEQPTVG